MDSPSVSRSPMTSSPTDAHSSSSTPSSAKQLTHRLSRVLPSTFFFFSFFRPSHPLPFLFFLRFCFGVNSTCRCSRRVLPLPLRLHPLKAHRVSAAERPSKVSFFPPPLPFSPSSSSFSCLFVKLLLFSRSTWSGHHAHHELRFDQCQRGNSSLLSASLPSLPPFLPSFVPPFLPPYPAISP